MSLAHIIDSRPRRDEMAEDRAYTALCGLYADCGSAEKFKSRVIRLMQDVIDEMSGRKSAKVNGAVQQSIANNGQSLCDRSNPIETCRNRRASTGHTSSACLNPTPAGQNWLSKDGHEGNACGNQTGTGQTTVANGLMRGARPEPTLEGQAFDADKGHSVLAFQDQIPAGHVEDARDGLPKSASRKPNEQGLCAGAVRPSPGCPAQPANGRDQSGDAKIGQPHVVPPVTPKHPTASQLRAMTGAKTTMARSLFMKLTIDGRPIGEWTYYGLVAVEKDGKFAAAVLREIGEVAPEDKHKEIAYLMCGNEDRLRRAAEACGKLKRETA